ncbi:MAG: hypothetical protein ACE5DI_05175 [Candidatus Micrarchaeia archaeon]
MSEEFKCPKCGYKTDVMPIDSQCPLCKKCGKCGKPVRKCTCIEGE